MKWTFAKLLAIVLVVSGCGETVTRGEAPRILTMGDSLMASNTLTSHSVSDGIEAISGEVVIDRSVVGARMINSLPIVGVTGLNIARQYQPGNWEWIIVNGGGNDLWLGCGCFLCDRKMGRLLAPDGKTGEINRLVSDLRATGARVIYVGYLRSPGAGSPIEHCIDEGDELERRIARMANAQNGVFFLSLHDMVPEGDTSFHALDRIHPSRKASREIAKRINAIIEENSI